VEVPSLDKVLIYNDDGFFLNDVRPVDLATLNRTMTDNEFETACLELSPYQRLLVLEAQMEKSAARRAGTRRHESKVFNIRKAASLLLSVKPVALWVFVFRRVGLIVGTGA